MGGRGLGQRGHGVVGAAGVGPARVGDHVGRRVGGPARLTQLQRQRCQLAAGHVEDLGVGGAAGLQRAQVGHRGGQAHAAAAATPGQRALGQRRRGQGGADARHHLTGNAIGLQRGQFFFEPTEHAGIATFEPHHPRMTARRVDQQRIDRGLPGGMAEAAFAHVQPFSLGRQIAQRGIGQRVEQHHLRLRQPARAAHGDQVGLARSGADEDHADGVGHDSYLAQQVRPAF